MEPRICVFKVFIVSAENLWSADLNSGKEPSKAAVSVHFPGQHGGLPFTSDPVLPLPPPPASCQTPASPQPTDAIDSPAAKNAKPKKPKGKADDHPPPPPPVPVSFAFNVMSDYVKPSDWLLWHHLVTDPLTLSFLWTSPSGQTQTVVGNAAIDLSELLLSEELSWERECVIAPVAPDDAVKADAVKGKKEAAGHKGTNSKSKKTNAVEEVAPILLPGAIVKVQISLDMPILPDEERLGGLLLEFDKFCVKGVPPQLVDVSPDNATYALAFELPGFSGSSWWETLSGVKQDIKENLAVARIHSGKVSVRMSEQNAGGILSTISGSDATPVEANEATDTAPSTLPPADSDAGTEKEVLASQNREALLLWNNVAIRRFLPCVAAKELKESIWKRRSWHGELARYSDSDSLPFHRDHLTISIDLSEFLHEGTCEANICCPLNPYNPRKDLLNENGSALNAQTVVSAGDANDSINPWQNCSSQLFFCVRTNRALEQVWKAPSKPALSLKDVLTLRPKFPTFEDRLKIAVDDFRVLVKAAAQSIMSLQENVASNSESGFNSIAMWSNRAEYNEKLKKRLSTELHETGAWYNLKEEMKGRILKVASEKLKLANGVPKDDNFLFYNSLYMQLMNVVKESIEELNARRREAFLNSADDLETGASKRLHTLEYLRELADEYEVDGDYRSANKCYVESLSQKNTCPDLWFEYGLFCMRGKWKDCGKAEECFIESLNLKEDHVLSLLALACLMWHRSFCLQAEVILNTIIELHSREEAIAWVLLGQVYLLNNGQTDNAESCFTRAEGLQKDVTSPILVSSLLRHPFSMSCLIQKSGISTNPYIDAAILLLDLHLPKEAQLILSMEHASFSCNIGVTFCLGGAKQLIGDYNEAEKLIKEVTVSCTTQAASIAAWTLLGHIYFLSASFQQSIEAYEWILQHISEGKIFIAFELLELGKSYLLEHQVDKAKRVFIDLCSVNPKSSSWLGAGMAFYEEGDMENAEAALAEGNVVDPWNFKIWAYLTLISLRADQMPKAEFAFKQAMDCITFPPLLVQMAEAFLAKGNSRLAEFCLQKLCEGKNGDAIARLLWGTGSWEQKIGLAKQIAELVQNNPEIQQLTGEYDPLWAMLERTGFQDIPTEKENPDTLLKELLALSCS